jgi:hypothetical protein
MTKRNTDREEDMSGDQKRGEDEESAGHNFSADYESDYTVPALIKQNQRIESGLMSPHDIPESMPVLRAFHEFLDQERRRTQRRMMVLAGVCIGLVAMVILCGALLVFNYGVNARYQYALMERDLSDVRDDAGKARTAAESSLTKYADRTDHLKDMIVTSQQQLTTVQDRVTATVEQQQRDIEALRRQIELLQASRSVAATGSAESEVYRKRQDELLRELERTRAELLLAKASAEQPPQKVQDRPSPRRVEPVLAPPPPIPVRPFDTKPVSVATTSGAASVEMPLVPHGADHPVSWRLPIPSR